MRRRWRLWLGLLLPSLGFLILWKGPTALAWLRGEPLLENPAAAFAKPEQLWPRFVIDDQGTRVLKQRNSSQIDWSTPLDDNLGGVRPPHLLFDADRVYVTHGDGVTALDAQDGKVLWHSPGPQDRLCLSGDLLLAAQCGESDFSKVQGHWLFARRVRTGEVAFKVALDRSSDPEEVRPIADLFLVQADEDFGGKGEPGKTLLIDPQGNIQHRFHRQIIDGQKKDRDYVFLTSGEVICYSPTDELRWVVPFQQPEWVAGGGMLLLPEGDLLAFLYGRICDSGVHVLRVDLQAGKQVWQADCHGLGVAHSAYEHEAKVEISTGKHLKVMSKASGGSFVELLDLSSGRHVARKQFGGPARRTGIRLLDWLLSDW